MTSQALARGFALTSPPERLVEVGKLASGQTIFDGKQSVRGLLWYHGLNPSAQEQHFHKSSWVARLETLPSEVKVAKNRFIAPHGFFYLLGQRDHWLALLLLLSLRLDIHDRAE